MGPTPSEIGSIRPRSIGRIAALTALSLVPAGLGAVLFPAPASAAPTFRISTVVGGLSHPWDVTWVGGLMLFDQRPGGIWSKRTGASPKRVSIGLPRLYVHSEGGMLGMVADPKASSNKRFYTCQTTAHSNGSAADVRVLRWRLTSDTRAVSDGAPVVTGIPLTSGRHSGCRLRFGADGKLYVGTGDAVTGTNPQNLQSLGGKILRVNWDGSIPRDNPFYGLGGRARYVYTYGHRNVQGLAVRPGTSQLWSAEHGPDRDDEINLNVAGGNYGWDPVPGYNEAVPMTDQTKYPAAISARWRSGFPTVATSGLTFFNSSAWGRWQGAMAVGLLKGKGIKIIRLDPSGHVSGTEMVAGISAYGRIRAVQIGPDKSLYFTTDNGSGDRIVKLTPTAKPPTVAPGVNVSGAGVSAVRTGSSIYAFVRTTGDAVAYRRSTDDGHSWTSAWTSAGVTTTAAPSVASSAPGRIDLVTRTSAREVIYTRYVDGARVSQVNLRGNVRVATVSSPGDGTLDVFGLDQRTGIIIRKHYDGTSWSRWVRLSGVLGTSMVGASANSSTAATVVTVRGGSGAIYERSLTATSNGSGWHVVSGLLWSGRAFGDTRDGVSRVAVSRGSDGYLRYQRGNVVQGLDLRITSDPDVVTRPDGSWIAFGRDTSGGLSYYDARSGQYRPHSLGGTVR